MESKNQKLNPKGSLWDFSFLTSNSQFSSSSPLLLFSTIALLCSCAAYFLFLRYFCAVHLSFFILSSSWCIFSPIPPRNDSTDSNQVKKQYVPPYPWVTGRHGTYALHTCPFLNPFEGEVKRLDWKNSEQDFSQVVAYLLLHSSYSLYPSLYLYLYLYHFLFSFFLFLFLCILHTHVIHALHRRSLYTLTRLRNRWNPSFWRILLSTSGEPSLSGLLSMWNTRAYKHKHAHQIHTLRRHRTSTSQITKTIRE